MQQEGHSDWLASKQVKSIWYCCLHGWRFRSARMTDDDQQMANVWTYDVWPRVCPLAWEKHTPGPSLCYLKALICDFFSSRFTLLNHGFICDELHTHIQLAWCQSAFKFYICFLYLLLFSAQLSLELGHLILVSGNLRHAGDTALFTCGICRYWSTSCPCSSLFPKVWLSKTKANTSCT